MSDNYLDLFTSPAPLSHQLTTAASCLAERPALAHWLRVEAAHAGEAENLADRASVEAQTHCRPPYRPATISARAVAEEALHALAADR
jgi:hypothetical protein